ncbi:hypothetical protein ANN_26822 [Periplaneta americana]|uniref:Uncharacterized protein n=1 Tax=Periplaneta americana TaxID=6978 RepID=A0ABQ8RZA8_PERAM|nr:hypothetical protein ANN_26822 [Periplaneta americana]
MRNLIAKGQLDDAICSTTNLMRKDAIPARRRYAQQWFDSKCYTMQKRILSALQQARTMQSPEQLETYAETRRQYKRLLKTNKCTYLETEAMKLVEETKRNPFITLRRKQTVKSREIPMLTWENHFTAILNQSNKEVAYAVESVDISISSLQIQQKEIQLTINKVKTYQGMPMSII